MKKWNAGFILATWQKRSRARKTDSLFEKVKKNGKLLFFEKQDNDKLIYEQKKVHVFMLYFIDVDRKEYTNLAEGN